MSVASHRRRRMDMDEGDGVGWIPGLGENQPRPQSSRSPRSGSELITSEESSRSASPRPGSDIFGGSKRRPRTAHASDSSQMHDIMWTPPSPEEGRVEVEEEACVAVDAKNTSATPFFEHNSGKILIKGGTVVNEDSKQEADVLIEDGTILEVGADLEVPSGAKIIDATDKFVLPGGIDTSTHLKSASSNDLQVEDDFATGTKAALAGGTTTIVDVVMPCQGETLSEAVAAWKEDVEANACCDVAFVVTLPEWNDTVKADMEKLVKEEGISAFKVHLAFKDSLMLSNDELMDVFEHCKNLGAVVHVHAENGDVVAENEKRLKARGVRGPEAHLMSRPEEIEEEAVKRSCTLARHSNVPLVICQPTSQSALQVISQQRERGQVVYGQVSAASMAVDGGHYYNDCWTHAAAFVTSPPLRDDPKVCSAINDALANDQYQLVSSDHKVFTTETKAAEGKRDFSKIPHGLNGLEDRMSVAWDKLVASNKGSVQRFVAVSSSNAAKMLGVYPQKGCIAPNSDADLVIWNPNNVRTISAKEAAYTNADFNVFEGLSVHGAPEYVISGGRVVVYEYEFNTATTNVGAKYVASNAFPAALYDAVQDLDDLGKNVPVDRSPPPADVVDAAHQSSQQFSNAADFGLTTPRKSSGAPVINKRLGIYQRPMSAHGVRNQQDSTFSLAGGSGPEPGEFGSPKRTVKVNAPPGGGSSKGFW